MQRNQRGAQGNSEESRAAVKEKPRSDDRRNEQDELIGAASILKGEPQRERQKDHCSSRAVAHDERLRTGQNPEEVLHEALPFISNDRTTRYV